MSNDYLLSSLSQHKEICEFPSKYFYDDQLITDESVISRTNPETKLEGFWPCGNRKPIMFVDLVGEEDMKARKGEGEKSNTKEAEKVVSGKRFSCCRP